MPTRNRAATSSVSTSGCCATSALQGGSSREQGGAVSSKPGTVRATSCGCCATSAVHNSARAGSRSRVAIQSSSSSRPVPPAQPFLPRHATPLVPCPCLMGAGSSGALPSSRGTALLLAAVCRSEVETTRRTAGAPEEARCDSLTSSACSSVRRHQPAGGRPWACVCEPGSGREACDAQVATQTGKYASAPQAGKHT